MNTAIICAVDRDDLVRAITEFLTGSNEVIIDLQQDDEEEEELMSA